MGATPTHRRLQALAIAGGVGPFLYLVWGASSGNLGANPVEEITHLTGFSALVLLMVTLAVTPAREIFSWPALAPLRRTAGLLTFFYACLHFSTWIVLDLGLDPSALVEDVLERRYVTAGFAAFLCLVPLAATSTRRMVRRLGRRWGVLHRLVYAAATLAVVHFLWLVKADRREPLIFATLLALLLGYRVVRVGRRRLRGEAGRAGGG